MFSLNFYLSYTSTRESGTVAASSSPEFRSRLGSGGVLSEAHAEAGECAIRQSACVGKGQASLAGHTVVSLSFSARSSGVGLLIPSIGVEGDAGPEQSHGQTDDQPTVLGINRVLRVPAELMYFTNSHSSRRVERSKSQKEESETQQRQGKHKSNQPMAQELSSAPFYSNKVDLMV